MFDATAVYVAIRSMEPDADRLVGMLTRRDETSPSDWVRVVIDSYRDRRTGYEFAVNAAGVNQDRYWFSDTNSDAGWDAVWDVAIARAADHWTAEFKIPFSQLRFNPNGGGTFGLDMKYRVLSGLALTATVNPDFGQVEADPAVVNLSAFEGEFQFGRDFGDALGAPSTNLFLIKVSRWLNL